MHFGFFSGPEKKIYFEAKKGREYLCGMGFLSFLQVICGVGSPVAIQTKAAIPPAFTFWLMGASLITGGSAKNEKQTRMIQDSNALKELTQFQN